MREALADPARRPPEPAEVGAVRFLHDPVGRKGEAPGVGHRLLDLLDGAEESVVIESPYLVPSRAFRRGLRARARARRHRPHPHQLARHHGQPLAAGGLRRQAQAAWCARASSCGSVAGDADPPHQGGGDRRRDGDRGLLQPRPALRAPQQRGGGGAGGPGAGGGAARPGWTATWSRRCGSTSGAGPRGRTGPSRGSPAGRRPSSDSSSSSRRWSSVSSDRIAPVAPRPSLRPEPPGRSAQPGQGDAAADQRPPPLVHLDAPAEEAAAPARPRCWRSRRRSPRPAGPW